jgi:RNA polymerase-binding transcription factor DksA
MQAAQIDRYKNRLLEMRSRLIGEINRMGEAVVEDIQSPGNLSHVPSHPADRDSEGLETMIALERTEGGLLNQVNSALGRIEQGSFGRCEGCGGEILRERLEALPYTPYCVQCERRHEDELREA